jgi:LCP family protein required for cell wall assembly
MGIDQRCDESGPNHTDSMMLVTIDPVGLSAAVMSLPRDMWVEIPGFEVDRINQAHYYGEAYEYPGGGPALAVETVEAFLGIQIDYYATVNFDAFIEVVDQIGGIDITVPEAIDDPTYPDRCYGYDPFSIEAGEYHLDGEAALKYARTRATLGGDVDRAARQQAVVLAVRDQVLSVDMIPQLIAQAPGLWQTLQANVRTDMTLEEGLQLALLAQDIPRESIKTAVIDYDYVYAETTPDGRQVLVPNRENIRELRNQLFTPPVIPTPEIKNLPALMAAEEARVAIQNGTTEFGLAGETQDYLLSQDVNVTEIGNADSSAYRSTQIIDYGNFPNTSLYLVQLMGIPPLNVSSGTAPEGDYDILIILGSDWEIPDQ